MRNTTINTKSFPRLFSRGIATILILLLVFGCISRQKAYTEAYGYVFETDKHKVCVRYWIVNYNERWVDNCFYYFDGDHSYEIGDVYPDPEKEGEPYKPRAEFNFYPESSFDFMSYNGCKKPKSKKRIQKRIRKNQRKREYRA
jgi:hypothetical protein